MLEQLGHPAWGVLAPPKSSVRLLRLLAGGLIIGGVVGGGLVASIISSDREDLGAFSRTQITQTTEAIPTTPRPVERPLVAPSTTRGPQAPPINGSNAGKDSDSETALPFPSAQLGNPMRNLATETLESAHSSGSVSATLPNQPQTPDHLDTQKPPTMQDLIAPSRSPPAETTGNNVRNADRVGGNMRAPDLVSSRASALLPEQVQTAAPPPIPDTPRKRELIASLSSRPAETSRNSSGGVNEVNAKMGERQQQWSSRALANLPDQQQTSEASTAENAQPRRKRIPPINNFTAHRQADESAAFFQPWWDGRKVADRQPRNSAVKQAGESGSFFRPWWYAQSAADRQIRNPE